LKMVCLPDRTPRRIGESGVFERRQDDAEESYLPAQPPST
jgi:hypothetical protein